MSISFLVEDIDEFVKETRVKGIIVEDPIDNHLGMRRVALEDPDGHCVAVQCVTT